MQRPLLISGFMATGKSAVGRRVAELTGRPFLDLDERVAARAGRSVSEIFRAEGEACFRKLERAELEAVLDQARTAEASPIVALGGGTLLWRGVRLRALDEAVVVTLDAPLDVLAARAEAQGGRPLLAGNVRARLEELLEQRRASYAEAHAVLETGNADVDAVARRTLEVWARDPIAVAAGERTYRVDIGCNIFSQRTPEIISGASRVVLVTDRNVAAHYGPHIRAALAQSPSPLTVITLEPGEQHKTLTTVDRIWRAALAAEVERHSMIFAFGGGVVSDVAGFSAACFMRGIRWAVAPSTLLAMVDASLGGKTGVDLDGAKNAIGAFWQPSAVLCDVAWLSTESDRGYRAAFAEIVKTALIGDPSLLGLLEQRAKSVLAREPATLIEVVRRSLRVKARVVGLDERESGLRATLNLGHTVGHALEAQGGYTRLTHGEAVSLGLVAALRVGERLGLTDAELTARVVRLLSSLGLPTDISGEPLVDAARLIGHDKKRAGSTLRFVVATAPGHVQALMLPLETLKDHLSALAGR